MAIYNLLQEEFATVQVWNNIICINIPASKFGFVRSKNMEMKQCNIMRGSTKLWNDQFISYYYYIINGKRKPR
jgi:hypothetical protein